MKKEWLPVQNNTAGVILVGGKSSRMGQDKALLPWKNFRLVDHIANVLREVGIKDLFVSGEVEGYQSIPDMLSERGPVGGICSSIMECYSRKFSNALIVPVDMPFFSAEAVRTLIDDNTTADARHFEKHPLPVLIKINEEILKYCRMINKELKNDQDMSVKLFLKNLSTESVKIPSNLVTHLTNTNTPEEWKKANES
jgi:molybdopterin-guanine dinucleotide biosynthesis protein A